MTDTTTATGSLWLTDDPGPLYPPPGPHRRFDVLVLGGGITGLTTALLLKRAGASVAVVEAARVGSGATGHNTAKVTALQPTMLSQIRTVRGGDVAVEYAQGNLAAVEQVAALVTEEGIDCDLQRRDAYTVAPLHQHLSAIEKEHRVAEQRGLPVELTEQVDLPYPVAGAVRLPHQLFLHPVRYARGLASAVHEDGGRCAVFEDTRALSVREGHPVEVDTNHGPLVGDQVVVATHYPVWDRGLFFARMEAVRAYCVAGRVRDATPRGMSITIGNPSWSYQSSGNVVIVSGQDHTAGDRGIDTSRFVALEDHLRHHWDVAELTHRWSAQDALPYDHTPMIGTYTPVSTRMFVGAGYSKWGLSGGTMAAMRLVRQLTAGDGAGGFSPHRLSVRGLPKLGQLQTKVALDIVGDRLRPGQASSAADIPPDEARVIRGAPAAPVYTAITKTHCTPCRCGVPIWAACCGSTKPRPVGTAPATDHASTWTARFSKAPWYTHSPGVHLRVPDVSGFRRSHTSPCPACIGQPTVGRQRRMSERQNNNADRHQDPLEGLENNPDERKKRAQRYADHASDPGGDVASGGGQQPT